MTRLPPPYPHQVVADWIAANDVHVLTDSVERRPRDIGRVEVPRPLDYDVCARRARKMQAEAIAAVGRTLRTGIGRVASNIIDSLRDRWRTRRQIERLSCLTPRLLDDIGISHEIRARVWALQAHRQHIRFHLHF